MSISATTIKIRHSHPGAILREDYLTEYGITAYALAKRIGVGRSGVGAIVRENAPVTPFYAVRFARVFGTTPRLWLNLQRAWDLQQEEARSVEAVAAIEPLVPVE